MLHSRPTRAIAALCALALSPMGCTVEEPWSPPLYSLELHEHYGEQADRKVRVNLDVSAGDGGTLNLDRVKLEVEPKPEHSLTKLESQLSEGVLTVGASSPWPEPLLRPMPQLVPVLRRVQTAMVLLDPGDTRFERAIARVFDEPASLGFTRLETRGGDVSIATIALAPVASKTRMAFATARGTRSDDGFTLEGKRWILGEPVEPMRIMGTRSVARANSPAGEAH